MQTPLRVGALPRSIALLLLATVPLACGGAKDGESGTPAEAEAKTPAPADVKATDVKSADTAAPPADTAAPPADTAAPPADTAAPPADTAAAPTTAASGPPPAGTSGADDGGSTGADETAGETGAAVDVEALLKEIKSKKTKDARVQTAVAEAEAGGADPVALAKALVTRGQALFDDPERAKPYFELANDKDPKSPNAAFELAKQAALVGDVDEAKKWLAVVHERKGKKLLKRIEFDPMWEIVKDDPDVRAMLK
jgi:hypothetical protein